MNILKNFLKKINIFSKPKINQKSNFIDSPEYFRAILNREIARADRYNKKFSLIVFNVNGYDESSILFFMNFLSSRIRLSDDAGWFDAHSICVLLPDTSLDFAREMAEEIRKNVSSTFSPTSCEVYMYPSTQWSSKIGRGEQ